MSIQKNICKFQIFHEMLYKQFIQMFKLEMHYIAYFIFFPF